MNETQRNRGTQQGFATQAGSLESRFGRMFALPPAKAASDVLLQALATAMVVDDSGAPITEAEIGDENPTITAGYTYLGQFIDHDITFDPTPLHAAALDLGARRDFRSPALDLDSMYGRGPADQPYLYDGNCGSAQQLIRATRCLVRAAMSCASTDPVKPRVNRRPLHCSVTSATTRTKLFRSCMVCSLRSTTALRVRLQSLPPPVAIPNAPTACSRLLRA
jgi:hypothetical protein